MLVDVFDFFARLWATIGAALQLNPDRLTPIAAQRGNTLLIATLTVLAGCSLLAGQSVILFVNRVRPGRFAFSLVFYGMIFTLGLGLWAVLVWLCAIVLVGGRPPLATIVRIVGLGSAPLVFGFLIFLPYLGSPIEWVLRIWGLLVLLVTVRSTFQTSIWRALVCAALGWLLVQMITHLLGHVLAGVRDWLWRTVTGTAFDTNEQDLIAAAIDALHAQLADWGAHAHGPDLPA